NEISRIVPVEKAPERRIGFGLLEERLSHAPDDSADCLAPRCPGIDDPPGIVGTDQPIETHQSKVGIHSHLREDSGEAKYRLRPSGRDRSARPRPDWRDHSLPAAPRR